MMQLVVRALNHWRIWRAARAERRATAAATRAIGAEIRRVQCQRVEAERRHQTVRRIDTRLRALMTARLKLELGQ